MKKILWTLIISFNSAETKEITKSVNVRYFFNKYGMENPLLAPNWYYYWTDGLGYVGQYSYDAGLSDYGVTTVDSATSWNIRIGPSSYSSAGIPPTGNKYINGFKAVILHEFWHRDHRAHNYSVRGDWNPPASDDFDGDGICDREPSDPPGYHSGGWEAIIGTDPTMPNSTEDGGNWAESHGTYGHEGIDWAHKGSQWE